MRKTSKKQISTRVCKSMTVDTTMREFKLGELKTSKGNQIKNPKQAIAIGLSAATKCPINFSYDFLDKTYKKPKLISFLKKDELQEILKTKYNDTDKFKGTKEELGKHITKRELIKFISLTK